MLHSQLLHDGLEALCLFRNYAQIPKVFLLDLGKGVARHLLASSIEADDATSRIENHDQSTDGVQYRRNNVALFLQSFFCTLEFSNVKRDAMDEPRASILPADHLGFAMKPDHPAISRQDPIGGTKRRSRKKHLCGFDAPA